MKNFVNLIICIVQFYCAYKFFDLFLYPKDGVKKHIIIIGTVLLGVVLNCVNLLGLNHINFIVSFALLICACAYFFDSKLHINFLFSFLYVGIANTVEILTTFVIQSTVFLDARQILENDNMYILIVSSTGLILIAIVNVLSMAFNKRKNANETSLSLAYLTILPIVSYFILYAFIYFASIIPVNKITVILSVAIAISLLMTNIALVYIIDDKIEKTQLKLKLEGAEHIQKNQDKIYAQYEKHSLETKKMIHDFKHHLNCIYAMQNNEKCRNDYIEEVRTILDKKAATISINTGNKILDIILLDKMNECSQRGIIFDAQILYSSLEFLSLTDTCAIFANVLDNAIEANINVQGEKYIAIVIKRRCNTIYINIKNAKCHSDKQMKNINILDQHGYGKINIEKAVKNYGGAVQFVDLGVTYEATITFPIISEEPSIM